jgi:hypothetical protein
MGEETWNESQEGTQGETWEESRQEMGWVMNLGWVGNGLVSEERQSLSSDHNFDCNQML